MKTVAGLAFLVVAFIQPVARAGVSVQGVVTDATGKPIRGAIIQVSADGSSVSRYSNSDGRYEIPVSCSSCSISASAFGFARKTETINTAEKNKIDITLSPRWDLGNLSGADLETLLPNNSDIRFLKSSCVACHSFDTIIHRRGSSEEEWRSFLPGMTAGKLRNPIDFYSPVRLNHLVNILVKYFGPNDSYLGSHAQVNAQSASREQLHHPELSSVVLQATIHEYNIPTGPDAVAHSITTAPDAAWFSEIGYRANKIGRFDFATSKFTEYPVPVPKSMPHTGIVARDGLVWMPLSTPGLKTKLVSVDPETGKVAEYPYPGKSQGAHTVQLDPHGNLWTTITGGGGEVWLFDTNKKQFRTYKFPVPAAYPKGSRGSWEEIPNEDSPTIVAAYHAGITSDGMVWFSGTEIGMIIRIDPATGAVKEYMAPPGVAGMRGMVVDRDDNVWFGDFVDHKLGKFDTKAETFKIFSLPTPAATPYGVTADPKTGYVWYADVSGNNVTRFDPKTGAFAEYPLPTRAASPRFIAVDRTSRVWFTEFMTGKIGYIDTGESVR